MLSVHTKNLSPTKASDGSPMARSKKSLLSPVMNNTEDKKLDYREQYIKVKEQINLLNGKLDSQIAKNDGEFLAAYRVSFKIILFLKLIPLNFYRVIWFKFKMN